MRSCDGTKHAPLASASASVERGSGSDLGTAGVARPRPFSPVGRGRRTPIQMRILAARRWSCPRYATPRNARLDSEIGWSQTVGGWASDGGKFRIGCPGARVFLCGIPHQGRRRCGLGHQGRRIRVCWVLFSRTRVDGCTRVSRPESDSEFSSERIS